MLVVAGLGLLAAALAALPGDWIGAVSPVPAERLFRGVTALLGVALPVLCWRLRAGSGALNTANERLRLANQDLKDSQLYLVQNEKMSALGQMVAGIAHEINTPLAYVKGTVQMLGENVSSMQQLAEQARSLTWMMRARAPRREVTAQFVAVEKSVTALLDDGRLQEFAGLVASSTHGIDQISEIVTNLKNFSRLDRARIDRFDVREGLQSTLVLANNMLKDRVRLVREFDDVPLVSAAPSQLNQVFLNLVTNAVQAVPQDREPVLTLRTFRSPAGEVCVEVGDNGAGIPDDVLPRIFDPFFTTKEIGKGSGMGLSISYKIVQEHGGRIDVHTEAGAGTRFCVVLPAERVVHEPSTARTPGGAAGGVSGRMPGSDVGGGASGGTSSAGVPAGASGGLPAAVPGSMVGAGPVSGSAHPVRGTAAATDRAGRADRTDRTDRTTVTPADPSTRSMLLAGQPTVVSPARAGASATRAGGAATAATAAAVGAAAAGRAGAGFAHGAPESIAEALDAIGPVEHDDDLVPV